MQKAAISLHPCCILRKFSGTTCQNTCKITTSNLIVSKTVTVISINYDYEHSSWQTQQDDLHIYTFRPHTFQHICDM